MHRKPALCGEKLADNLFLSQANNLDSQKAINAYFEDPTGPQTNVIPSTHKTLEPGADIYFPNRQTKALHLV